MIPSDRYRRNDNKRRSLGQKWLKPLPKSPDFLLTDYRELLQAKVDSATLSASLTSVRTGDPGAQQVLLGQLRWLAYKVAVSFARKSVRELGYGMAWRMEEVIGEAHIGLSIAVNRLANHEEQRSDIERFV